MTSPSAPSTTYLFEERTRVLRAQRFLMLSYIVTVIMIFAGLTSAIIVKSGDANWVDVSLPWFFSVNTLVIIVSSATLHWSLVGAVSNKPQQILHGLWITILLGVAFLAGQFVAYQQLILNDVFLVGNPAGSFIYVISGMHAVHLIGAIFAGVFQLVKAATYSINSGNTHGLRLFCIFWHSMGVLWIYLYAVLYYIY